MLCIDLQKRHIKGEKHIAQIDFAEHLRKSDVSENSKIYYGRFLQNGLMKGIVILVKVDEMYKIFKSLLANRFWSRDGIGGPKFLLESAFQCAYVYYVPALLRRRFHLIVTISHYFSFTKCRL